MAGKGNPNLQGRSKDTRNKRTLEAIALMERMGVDPLERLLKRLLDPATDDSLKVKLELELLQYAYPKLKAIEMQAQANEGNERYDLTRLSDKDRDALPKILDKARAPR